MKEFTDQVAKFQQLLDSPDTENASEDANQFVFRHILSGHSLKALPLEFLRSFVDSFGRSLDLRVSELVGDEPINELRIERDTIANGECQKFFTSLGDGGRYKLAFTIDKPMLLQDALGDVQGRALLYFSAEPVLNTLTADLLTLEKNWFRPGEKLFLLLGQSQCLQIGPMLHILGDVPIDTVRRYVYDPLSDQLKSKLEKRIGMRSAETHWQNGARFLLPEHLVCEERGGTPDNIISTRLNGHLMDLLIASLANFTSPQDSGWMARFEGQKRMEVQTAGKHGLPAPVSFEMCAAWFDVYNWVYEDRTRDKISIVRNLLTLQPYEIASQNYGVFTAHAHTIAKSAQSHYDTFIRDSIKQYFDKIKEANTYLQSKIDAIGNQVTSLADTFTKNLLTTAGFIVGTLLTKLIDPNLSHIYPVIIGAFVIYMVVILIVYYPLVWRTYCLNREDYQRGYKGWQRIFSETDLKELIGLSFQKRETLFKWAFWGTLGIHVCLAVAGIWYSHTSQTNQLQNSIVVKPSNNNTGQAKPTGGTKK